VASSEGAYAMFERSRADVPLIRPLTVLLFGGLNTFIFRTMPVIVVTALFGCWFLGESLISELCERCRDISLTSSSLPSADSADAIAYAARRYDSTTRCQAGVSLGLGLFASYCSICADPSSFHPS
jgi:hypothetical protein